MSSNEMKQQWVKNLKISCAIRKWQKIPIPGLEPGYPA
jgi:hypothetical protein